MRGLFITGTDTGVGKTAVAAAVIRSLRGQGRTVGAYKPAASGAERDADGLPHWSDAEVLGAAAGGTWPLDRICPQRFLAPLAPPVAARLEGRAVDADLLWSGYQWWTEQTELVIVEGAGGLLSPISDELLVSDLVEWCGLPLVIVGRLGLGTINHVLLTVEAALRRGLPVAGVLLNAAVARGDDPSQASNPAEVARHCPVPLLGVIDFLPGGDLLQAPGFVRLNPLDWIA